MSNNLNLNELLTKIEASFIGLAQADRAGKKEFRRNIAAGLNGLATLAGLKPVELGGIPLDDDTDEMTIGEIPT